MKYALCKYTALRHEYNLDPYSVVCAAVDNRELIWEFGRLADAVAALSKLKSSAVRIENPAPYIHPSGRRGQQF